MKIRIFLLPFLSALFLFVLNNMPILLDNKKKQMNNEEIDMPPLIQLMCAYYSKAKVYHFLR